MQSGNHAEVTASVTYTWGAVVLDIEDVEKLRPELDCKSLPKMLLLHEREINVVIQRAA